MGEVLERIAHPLAGVLRTPWRVGFGAMYHGEVARHEVAEHPHRDHELMLIQRGTWSGTIDGRPLAVRAPSLIAVQPGQLHADTCTAPLRMAVVQLTVMPGAGDGVSARLLAPDAHPVLRLAPGPLRELELLAEAMRASAAAYDASSAPVLDALAAAFLWTWAARVPLRDLVPEAAGYIEASGFAARLHDVFARHERGHLGLAGLAKAMGMSPRTLTWQCRRRFGAPPARLFQRHRLVVAWECLRASSLGVAEVAERYGFASPAHFSTAFRRYLGAPPRVLRRT